MGIGYEVYRCAYVTKGRMWLIPNTYRSGCWWNKNDKFSLLGIYCRTIALSGDIDNIISINKNPSPSACLVCVKLSECSFHEGHRSIVDASSMFKCGDL